MADVVYVLLTLVFFGICAVLAGIIDRRSDLRAEALSAAAKGDAEAEAQK